MLNKTSIKTIAAACGVSTATASAVLTNKNGNIRYSAITRDKILKAAKSQNYSKNILAYAMVSGKIPFVALAVHLPFQIDLNLSLYDTITATAAALEVHQYEMVFVPYTNKEILIKKVKRLTEGRLAAGIILNGVPNEIDFVFSYLTKNSMPFVYLGPQYRDDIISVGKDSTELYKYIAAYAAGKNYHRFIIVTYQADGNNTCKLLFLDEKQLPLTLSQIKQNPESTLFVCMGGVILNQITEHIPSASGNIITVEDSRLPSNARPVIFSKHKNGQQSKIAVEKLVKWINTGTYENGHTNIGITLEELILQI